VEAVEVGELTQDARDEFALTFASRREDVQLQGDRGSTRWPSD
jgi:hypothetical protein